VPASTFHWRGLISSAEDLRARGVQALHVLREAGRGAVGGLQQHLV